MSLQAARQRRLSSPTRAEEGCCARVQVNGLELESPAPTLEEALDSYLDRLRLLNRADYTVSYYSDKIGQVIASLGRETHFDALTQQRIEAYVLERKKTVKAGTVNKELRALRTLYRLAEIRPAWSLPELTHQPRRRMVRPPEVIARLWLELDEEMRRPVGLCLLAGMRTSEALAADASWCRWEEGGIWIPVRKTGEWNRTALVETLDQVLPRVAPLVTLPVDRIRHRLEVACKRVDIAPPIRGAGAFRHHCATWAVESGKWSRDQVREVLSHKSGSVTDRYIHSQAVTQKRAILETVEAALLEAIQAAN